MKTINEIFNSLVEETLAKQWQKTKKVKSGKIELIGGKSGVHTIKKDGKVIGDFSLEDDSDLWVVNLKGKKGQKTFDDIDALVAAL